MRDIVNTDDEVIGQAEKSEIEEKGLICRVAFVMLHNARGELLLHQRAATKRAYPLYWSGAAAGHVNAGETYEEAAHRELHEELGIETKCQRVGNFYSEADREMVGVFLGSYDGPIKIEEAEVARVEHFSLDRLSRERDAMLVTSFVDRSLPMVAEALKAVQDPS
ncbi:NUDIX domain-containing protein [Streptomyces sp. NBC_00620]|uniref:NUDIX hydrolase n=1 Tax=Streptomyces sp. NBC_00620 TaxID=2903666 RepID=UPI00224CEF3F|nr:NUDIX domain-containing protein [Streptomyces sp. NBC_00620]MCX4972987.1 NUDIX domain-containing protein [Streptomyces sp. NBC_00620]